VILEKQSEVAAEFDSIHTVERAAEVGSLERIIEPREVRPWLISELDRPFSAEVAASRNGGSDRSGER
jgi:hypothetical protein